MVGKKRLDVKHKKIDIKNGCAINCVAMVFDYYKKDFNLISFLEGITCRDKGYDLSEIAIRLIENGEKVEFGFWDDEIIGKKNSTKDRIKISDIKEHHVLKKLEKDKQDVLMFAKEHPTSINLNKPTFGKIKEYIDNNIPLIIHVDVSKYHDNTDDSIHSVIVAGYDEKRIYLVDPILGRIYKSKNIVLNAWKHGGKYYLVIKR